MFVLLAGLVFALSDRGGRATLKETEDAVIINGEGKALLGIRGDQAKFKLWVRGLPYLIDTGDLEESGVKQYHFYEAWLITNDDKKISMGAFNVDRNGRAKMEHVFDIDQVRDRTGNLVELRDVNKVIVTVEKQDGDNMPGETILVGEI